MKSEKNELPLRARACVCFNPEVSEEKKQEWFKMVQELEERRKGSDANDSTNQ